MDKDTRSYNSSKKLIKSGWSRPSIAAKLLTIINWDDARHSLHDAPLTDVCTPLHALSKWSAVFHFVAPLTDMRIPLHALSDWSAVIHFIDPLTDMRTLLHAPSGLTVVFHFMAPLIGIYAIHVFLLLTYIFFFPMRHWYCLCCCPISSCSCNHRDTNW